MCWTPTEPLAARRRSSRTFVTASGQPVQDQGAELAAPVHGREEMIGGLSLGPHCELFLGASLSHVLSVGAPCIGSSVQAAKTLMMP